MILGVDGIPAERGHSNFRGVSACLSVTDEGRAKLCSVTPKEDTERTLDICGRLIADRDDMIVKALSWALRELVVWDPNAVRRFLETHGDALAPRILREVRNKLETGLKNVRRAE